MRGPLPVSEDSRPWLAASHTQTPIDLAALGWVEEEFLISGSASVHDWGSDSGLVTLATAAPYGTRLLLRRPADPARFNGTVVVELLNDARVYDWAFLWALSWQHFVDEGMVWVGISHTPQAIEALKHFDAERYVGLGMANPTPTEACGQPAATSPFEEGLQWDAISQAGALLKAGRAGGPLQGFAVQRLFLTSHHGQAGTYANSLHPQARLADGSPVYDGFLLESADASMRLHRCGSAPAAGDERQVVRNAGVPVIRIVPEGEALAASATRRADSDDPADPFRQLEIPAVPRMDGSTSSTCLPSPTSYRRASPLPTASGPTTTAASPTSICSICRSSASSSTAPLPTSSAGPARVRRRHAPSACRSPTLAPPQPASYATKRATCKVASATPT